MTIKKYAVMWASTDNIGDDIQTLAGINFLEKKGITDYTYIDRERLSDYNGPPVVLVMNGWFTNAPGKFLPSKNITPLFISFHCDYRCHNIISDNIEYFKLHGPIGCRDLYTVDVFRANGIDAYFTGCLSLYFDEYNNKNDQKYLVDINGRCCYVPNFDIDMSLYNGYIKIEHLLESHLIFNLKARLERASNLLKIYREAAYVITARIHCAMPCRAFGTKCTFAHKDYNTDCRFKGLEKILNGKTEPHHDTTFNITQLNQIKLIFDDMELKG